jgi:hypothetical protein
MTQLEGETEAVVSLHADAMPSSTSAFELALTTVLGRKGRILDSLVDSDTRIRSHLTPQLRDQLDQLAQGAVCAGPRHRLRPPAASTASWIANFSHAAMGLRSCRASRTTAA